jgi:branched-chain amino acid aminotransferase
MPVTMPEPIAIERVPQSRLTEGLRERSDFGATFSDHMLVADYDGSAWGAPRLVPYGPLEMPPSLSALHYGQSIFEGFKAFRWADGSVALFRPRANFERLNRSAARFAMPAVPESVFLDGVKALVGLDREWVPRREGGSLYIRPLYFATDEALGVKASKRYRFVILTCPVGPYFTEPVRVVAEEHYVRAFPGGTGDAKPAGNYGGSLLATCLAQKQGFHTVLWLDAREHRFIEECGMMNVFFVIRGVAVTPPLTGTILPGVTRDSLLTLLPEMGIKAEERAVSVEDLMAAHGAGELDEAFGAGTAATVAPIGTIRYRDREIQLPTRPDSVAERVRARLHSIRTGQEADTHGWLTRL